VFVIEGRPAQAQSASLLFQLISLLPQDFVVLLSMLFEVRPCLLMRVPDFVDPDCSLLVRVLFHVVIEVRLSLFVQSVLRLSDLFRALDHLIHAPLTVFNSLPDALFYLIFALLLFESPLLFGVLLLLATHFKFLIQFIVCFLLNFIQTFLPLFLVRI
jgi:hypothetical protein